MRNIVFFYLFLLLGCTNPQITAELEKVDELMSNHPDSAYALIRSINPDDIHGRDDRALYALLYTQAQYKNYEPIQSDSLIDVAVDYYENKPVKDRLTRTYMYKAAALSDMERHKEAIEWLKKAETVADTSDYLTLGLISSHIGELYQRNYVINNEDIKRYKQALSYYRQAGNKRFENYTLSSIGKLYRNNNIDSAIIYLRYSVDLSKELQDNYTLIKNFEMMAYSYILCSNYIDGRDAALFAYNNSDNNTNIRLLASLSTIYTKLGKIDSAEYYFYAINTLDLRTAGDSVAYYMASSEIESSKNNYKIALEAEKKASAISDSVIDKARKNDLLAAEKQFDYTIISTKSQQLESQIKLKNYFVIIVTLIFVIIVGIIYFLLRRRTRLANKQIEIVEQMKLDIDDQIQKIDTMKAEKDIYKERIDKIECDNNHTYLDVKRIIDDRIEITRKLARIMHEYGSNPELFLKKIDSEIFDFNKNRTEPALILSIANQLNNNIIDRISAKYPTLNDKELMILALTCLDFKPIEMYIFLKFPTVGSINTARHRLAKELKISSLNEITLLSNKF